MMQQAQTLGGTKTTSDNKLNNLELSNNPQYMPLNDELTDNNNNNNNYGNNLKSF
jgi:hypothetical protein